MDPQDAITGTQMFALIVSLAGIIISVGALYSIYTDGED